MEANPALHAPIEPMEITMNRSLPLLLVALTVPATAADTHPFSVRDMLAMDRISEPVVSPDGSRVAYSVRVTDMAANKGRYDVWLSSADGTTTRRLTQSEANDNQPAWSADGRSLYFVSTRSGGAQVWRISLEGGEPEQVTRLSQDVEAFSVAPGDARLVVAMAVFPGKSPEETKKLQDEKAQSKASGMLYQQLFVRHWDGWANGTRNHVFAYDIEHATATDLMPAMDADCPTRPFGDAKDWSVSPDGKTLVFAARDVGRTEAWSTNVDLFSVPLDGGAAPRRLTTSEATDSAPRHAPDGKRLAYLAMSRPGYEADRNRVVVRDLASGSEKSFDLRVGVGAHHDRSPDDLAWTPDSRELLTSADSLGEKPAFVMDANTGVARVLVGDGHVTATLPLGGARVLVARDSLLGPTFPLASP